MGLDLYHFSPVKNNSDDSDLDCFIIDESDFLENWGEPFKQFIVEKKFQENGKIKVIYFESRGYQRKGMNRNFYNDFENDKLYFDVKTVIKAYHYLEADHISNLAELQHNFRNNFINNFVEGDSVFLASW